VLLHDITARIVRGWEITLWNDAFTFSITALTRKALARLGAEDAPRLLADLLSGDAPDDVIHMESALSIASTTHLAAELARQPDLLDAVRARGQGALSDPIARAFAKEFEAHLHRFGDRTMNELKLETRTFRQRPEDLLALLVSYADNPQASKAGSGDTSRYDRAWNQVVSLISAGVECSANSVQWKVIKKLALQKGVRKLVQSARKCMRHRENSRFDRSRAYGIARAITTRIGEQMLSVRLLDDAADVYLLHLEEIESFSRTLSQHGGSVSPQTRDTMNALLHERRTAVSGWRDLQPEGRFWIRGFDPGQNTIPQEGQGTASTQLATDSESNSRHQGDDLVLCGIGSSPGRVSGTAAVLDEPSVGAQVNGKILVTRMTDPGWVFLMVNCAGLVSEKGSILSHTAIIGREMGIPTVVGVTGATKQIADGASVVVDGSTGKITITRKQAQSTNRENEP
jgi:pyruvate,water dikinase